MLGGHKRLNECVSCLSVEGQSVAEGGQLRTLLQEGLLQPVASCMEVLLQRKQMDSRRLHIKEQVEV